MSMYPDELDSLVFGFDDETLLTEELECEDMESVLEILNIKPSKRLHSEKD